MNPLLKLLALNKSKPQEIRSETVDGEATVYLYGVIVSDDYFGGVSAEAFARELNAIKEPRIHVRIHSPGGDAFAGVAMAQIMRDHPSEIIVHVDGDAASAATFLVIAANKSVIAKRARFMIHNAWTIAAGNQFDFLDISKHLARVDQNIAEDYSEKTGDSVEKHLAWMKETTFFYGEEAVEAGFIDAVAEGANGERSEWDYSAYDDKPIENQIIEALARIDNAHKPENKDPDPTPQTDPEPEPEKPDLSMQYRQLEVVQLTA